MLHRSDVPEELTWDLSALYPSVTEWEADLERLDQLIAGYETARTRAGRDADSLLAVLRLRDEIQQTLDRIAFYADNRLV